MINNIPNFRHDQVETDAPYALSVPEVHRL